MIYGESESPVSGNKTSTDYGSGDYWLVKVDKDGSKLWEDTYGRAAYDDWRIIQSIAQARYY